MKAPIAAGMLVLAAIACQENVVAPGVCPDFCPQGNLDVRDTILNNVILSDSFFEGYKLAHEATELQISSPGGSSGDAESRALIVFFPFSVIYTGSDTTVGDTIRQTDSIRVSVLVTRRNTDASGAMLVLHRIPLTVDSATTFADMEPYFADSMMIGSAAIPDTLVNGTVDVTAPISAFPNFGPDSLQLAVGMRIAASGPAFVSLPSLEDTVAVSISRFVQVDSGSVRVTRSDVPRTSLFDTFVLNDTATTGSGILRIGGVPAARAHLRTGLPSRIVDSTQVVRATLLLVPARPALGAPSDTFQIAAYILGAELGPKSPLADTTTIGSARVPVGADDTVRVDVTHVFNAWRANPALPRTLMLQVVRADEAASLGMLVVHATSSGVGAPSLHLTFMPPFNLKR